MRTQHAASKKINWSSLKGKQCKRPSKNERADSPESHCAPLGVHTEEMRAVFRGTSVPCVYRSIIYSVPEVEASDGPSPDEQIKKTQSTDGLTMEYSSAYKREEILSPADGREDAVLSKTSQAQGTNTAPLQLPHRQPEKSGPRRQEALRSPGATGGGRAVPAK